MKKQLFKIFGIALVLIQTAMFSQKTDSITIQFNKDKLTNIRYKSTCRKNFVIRVEGINTALHKVAIKFDDFYWFTETPEALKAILPNFKLNAGRAQFASDSSKADSINFAKHIEKFNYIDNAITLIASFKDSIESKTYNANSLKKYANLIVKRVDSLQNKMNYFTGYYETLIEMSKSTYDEDLAIKIGQYKDLYEFLRKNKKNLLSGVNIIIVTDKKAPEDFFNSKVHTFSKPVTTAQIYIIDRFDLDDTIAVYEEDIYKDGRVTLDFSTGVALNSLVKPQYYIGDNGSGKFIGNERTRELDFSVVALLHLNIRVCSWLSIGPATGISVSAFDANTGYIYGGSISIGKQRSFSITAGGILGKTVALSKKISSDGSNADLAIPADISSVPTYDKIGKGGFVSFTYNLTRIRKKS